MSVEEDDDMQILFVFFVIPLIVNIMAVFLFDMVLKKSHFKNRAIDSIILHKHYIIEEKVKD